jgi:hypothetical protein
VAGRPAEFAEILHKDFALDHSSCEMDSMCGAIKKCEDRSQDSKCMIIQILQAIACIKGEMKEILINVS